MKTRSEIRKRWRRILQRQRASRSSAVAFCRQEGIAQSTFFAWQRRLRDEPSFAEVKVSPIARQPSRNSPNNESDNLTRSTPSDIPIKSSGVELHLPGAWRVVVQQGFDRHTLQDLLQVLDELSLAPAAQETAP